MFSHLIPSLTNHIPHNPNGDATSCSVVGPAPLQRYASTATVYPLPSKKESSHHSCVPVPLLLLSVSNSIPIALTSGGFDLRSAQSSAGHIRSPQNHPFRISANEPHALNNVQRMQRDEETLRRRKQQEMLFLEAIQNQQAVNAFSANHHEELRNIGNVHRALEKAQRFVPIPGANGSMFDPAQAALLRINHESSGPSSILHDPLQRKPPTLTTKGMGSAAIDPVVVASMLKQQPQLQLSSTLRDSNPTGPSTSLQQHMAVPQMTRSSSNELVPSMVQNILSDSRLLDLAATHQRLAQLQALAQAEVAAKQQKPSPLVTTEQQFVMEQISKANELAASMCSATSRADGMMAGSPNTTRLGVGASKPRAKRKKDECRFPEKLFQLLTEVEEHGQEDTISFLPDGKSFVVRQPSKFEKEVMPKYFKTNRMSSFYRQLNLYGFMAYGKDAGAFYHPSFQRGEAHLLKNINRKKQRTPGEFCGSEEDRMAVARALSVVGRNKHLLKRAKFTRARGKSSK